MSVYRGVVVQHELGMLEDDSNRSYLIERVKFLEGFQNKLTEKVVAGEIEIE